MPKKFNKLVAITAIIGAAVATAAAIFTKFRHHKKCEISINNSDEEDFDSVDFADISNDTPRNYVSIQINERTASNGLESGEASKIHDENP